jgi:YD repeat-containing protein
VSPLNNSARAMRLGLGHMVLSAGPSVCAFLVAALTFTSASAQNVPGGGGDAPISRTLAPPPERLLVTPGGVDMRTGRYHFSQTDLSIGEDNETGGLALTRGLGTDAAGHINPLGNFSHNYDIFITIRPTDQVTIGNGAGIRARVHFGGRSETFEQAGSSPTFEQVSRSGYARLSVSGNVYTFSASDGTVAVFRASLNDCLPNDICAFVSTITYADGTRFTFAYDPAGTQGTARLRSVTSNRGYALKLHYGSGSAANLIVSACVFNLALAPAPADHSCPTGTQATASYNYLTLGSEQRLAAATDAAGSVWAYSYAPVVNGLTMTFTRPGETSPWLTNTIWVRPNMDSVDEVITHQLFADNATYSYSYDTSPQVDGEIPQIAGGYYIDPAGNQTTIAYDFPPRPSSFNPPRVKDGGYPVVNFGDIIFQITPGPVAVTDPLGRITRYDYCDPTAAASLPAWEHHRCLVTPMAVSSTEPDGRRTDYLWEFQTRNLLRTRRHPNAGSGVIENSATYNCSPTTMAICAKPISTTDARGNVTDYAYDMAHGGLLSVTGPAPTPGAPRPQTRHGYALRHAWISNGSGGYVQAPTPIWVRAFTSTCRTSAATGNPPAPCATAGDEVRTAYDYGPDSGPNTLLLRGQVVTATDGGATTSLRTCYGYDARGRRISETQPNANLGSCP